MALISCMSLLSLLQLSPLHPFFPAEVVHFDLGKWDLHSWLSSASWALATLAHPFQPRCPTPCSLPISWPVLSMALVAGCERLAALVNGATQVELRNRISSSLTKKVGAGARKLQRKKCCRCIYCANDRNTKVKGSLCFAELQQFQPLNKKP